LLRILVDYHGPDPQELCANLAAGNLMEVGRLAHSLKGAAGNFGALRIQAMADELVLAIENKAARVDVERLTAALAEELAALINAVKSSLPSAGEGKSLAATDGDQSHNPP
jgi:two-component system, sensor histidine kinase and response regulator